MLEGERQKDLGLQWLIFQTSRRNARINITPPKHIGAGERVKYTPGVVWGNCQKAGWNLKWKCWVAKTYWRPPREVDQKNVI